MRQAGCMRRETVVVVVGGRIWKIVRTFGKILATDLVPNLACASSHPPFYDALTKENSASK